MTAVLVAGAVVGLGLYLLAGAALRPRAARSGAAAALAELDARRLRMRRDSARALLQQQGGGGSGRLWRLGTALLDALEARGLRLPAELVRDLALQGRSPALHCAYSVVGAVCGFVGLLLGAGLLGVFVPSLRGGTPVWAALLGALAGAILPTGRVVARAGDLRRDVRHVVGSFLDLVAMNLAGGRGVPEALQSAASISDSWAMLRIRECLETARLQGITPWVALGGLGEDTGIDELRDLAAALALVADDGAKVRQSLSARATSLRRRELADTEGRAQARSQSMLVAQLLLALGFLIFLIYPAIARIITS